MNKITLKDALHCFPWIDEAMLSRYIKDRHVPLPSRALGSKQTDSITFPALVHIGVHHELACLGICKPAHKPTDVFFEPAPKIKDLFKQCLAENKRIGEENTLPVKAMTFYQVHGFDCHVIVDIIRPIPQPGITPYPPPIQIMNFFADPDVYPETAYYWESHGNGVECFSTITIDVRNIAAMCANALEHAMMTKNGEWIPEKIKRI